MSTAIERVEAQLAHDERGLIQVERADLTELARLAKLGARVEQCEYEAVEMVTVPGDRIVYAADLLAWLREEQQP